MSKWWNWCWPRWIHLKKRKKPVKERWIAFEKNWESITRNLRSFEVVSSPGYTSTTLTRRVIPAPREVHSRQGRGKDNVAREAPEGQTRPVCNSGIKDRGARRQLRLRKQRTSDRIFRKTGELEIDKRVVGFSIGLRKVRDWTWWRGRPLPKRKKRSQKRTALGKEGWCWYNWTAWHLIREPLGTSGLKEGTAGAVRE
jgi:hypothetical protein